MKFTRTAIPDVIMIDPLVHGDERGYFVETFRKDTTQPLLSQAELFTYGDKLYG